jgi:hypothetical protein
MSSMGEVSSEGEAQYHEWVGEAVDQMRSYCQQITETDYHSVSARGVLYTLGYTPYDADTVLTELHKEGFDYCLDPMFPSKTLGKDEPTPDFACYWGPDQLKSRIDCCTRLGNPHNYR